MYVNINIEKHMNIVQLYNYIKECMNILNVYLYISFFQAVMLPYFKL